MPAAEATGSPRSTGTPCTPSAAASSSSGGGQCCKEENCEQPRTGMSEYCLGHRKGLTRSECLERRPGSVVWTTSVMAQRCGRLGCEGDRAGPSGFCSAHRPDREEASSSSTSAQIRLGNYHVGSIIGSGAFCEVRIGHHVVTKQKYAVKVMSLQAVKEMRCEDLICMEIQLLLDLQHPNIIRAHEAMRTEDCIVIVMDFMSGGELFDMITQHGRLTAAQSRGYYQDLLRGVCALHAASIAHRDLKPENLLLEGGRLKIADLGFCAFQAKGEKLWEVLGTPEYQAPEVTPGAKYCGFAADMWSCGVCLYAMIVGALPFDGNGDDEALRAAQLAGPPLPDDIEAGPAKVIRDLVVVDPAARPSAFDLLTEASLWTYLRHPSAETPPGAVPESEASSLEGLPSTTTEESVRSTPPAAVAPQPAEDFRAPEPPNTRPPDKQTLTAVAQLAQCSSEHEEQLFGRSTQWSFTSLFEDTKSFLGSFGKTSPSVIQSAIPQRPLVRPRARWRRR